MHTKSFQLPHQILDAIVIDDTGVQPDPDKVQAIHKNETTSHHERAKESFLQTTFEGVQETSGAGGKECLRAYRDHWLSVRY